MLYNVVRVLGKRHTKGREGHGSSEARTRWRLRVCDNSALLGMRLVEAGLCRAKRARARACGCGSKANSLVVTTIEFLLGSGCLRYSKHMSTNVQPALPDLCWKDVEYYLPPSCNDTHYSFMHNLTQHKHAHTAVALSYSVVDSQTCR